MSKEPALTPDDFPIEADKQKLRKKATSHGSRAVLARAP
ncbi:hypothetical protein ABIF64_006175 [Bradyrhizobium japonicum]|nr:hypothetical protein [Bradyrhizobium japonicum]MCP1788129.1 hypothetical protein [Bradyrhizobium japonicum]MCP1810005.1 hypothetical protein [Bradyrhizobium japonicum]MCP1818939.1 hypothetical protein [Bradyrhizobium japonicum]MCP1869551.1 hypothetical protein [Bradyrhizobium japonicum]